MRLFLLFFDYLYLFLCLFPHHIKRCVYTKEVEGIAYRLVDNVLNCLWHDRYGRHNDATYPGQLIS